MSCPCCPPPDPCFGECTVETIEEDCATPCGCVDGQCVKCGCAGCDEAIQLAVDGRVIDSLCINGTWYGTGDGVEQAPDGCDSCETCAPFNSHGGNTAIMFCEADPASQRGIRYRVIATSIFDFAAFPECLKSCTVVYEGFVAVDAECRPVAGNVTLTEITRENVNGGCAHLQPIAVSVVRA